MKVELVFFAGCPHVSAARAALRDALAAEHCDSAIVEIDVDAPAAPPWAHRWGSPTILIDGTDVAGEAPQSATCCRLYAGGAPTVAAIRAAIRNRLNLEPRPDPR